mgnify:CR=1 FL=1
MQVIAELSADKDIERNDFLFFLNDFQLFLSGRNLGSNGINSFKKSMKLYIKNKKFDHDRVNLFDDKLISYRIK